MNATYICDFSVDDVGARFRRPRSGPETELVDAFVSGTRFKSPRGCRTTLFREPRLVSGFPDLVAVTWHVPTAARWSGARRVLSTGDLRLVQLLVSNGTTSEKQLRDLAGRDALRGIARLEAAGLAHQRGGLWRARRLKEAFAVRGIVAFEAKMADWSQALAQAFQNTWFASESYVLVPRRPKTSSLLADAQRLGIGVWVNGENSPILDARENDEQPVSYASWAFNEWAWRHALSGTDSAGRSG